MDENFFSLTDLSQGIPRELAPGVNTHVFAGDQAMLSVVELAPNARGSIHSHPEEQWGLMLSGSGVRIQGGVDHPVKQGDFWRTPGGVEHGLVAGPQGCRVLDVFAPPREAYKKAGQGFGA
jgi:quercetin dioxygenase-like cupin family protein